MREQVHLKLVSVRAGPIGRHPSAVLNQNRPGRVSVRRLCGHGLAQKLTCLVLVRAARINIQRQNVAAPKDGVSVQKCRVRAGARKPVTIDMIGNDRERVSLLIVERYVADGLVGVHIAETVEYQSKCVSNLTACLRANRQHHLVVGVTFEPVLLDELFDSLGCSLSALVDRSMVRLN